MRPCNCDHDRAPFRCRVNTTVFLAAAVFLFVFDLTSADGGAGGRQCEAGGGHCNSDAEGPTPDTEDLSSLLQLSRLQGPAKSEVVNTSLSDLNLWFGYLREGLQCFKEGDLQNMLLEHGGREAEDVLRASDLVVLLEAERRPSASEAQKMEELIDFDMETCNPLHQPGIDEQIKGYLGEQMELVQLNILSENDPKRVEETLLNVWYDPEALRPGRGLAYKNNFPGGPAGTCQDNEAAALMGSMEVSADSPFHMCADAVRKGWKHYNSSEGTLAMSFLPAAGGEPFAILGLSMAPGDFEGKLEMLARAKFDIHSKLGVAHHRVFTIGEGASDVGPGAGLSHFFKNFGGPKMHPFSFTENLSAVVTIDGHHRRKTQLLQQKESSVTWLRFQHGKRMAASAA